MNALTALTIAGAGVLDLIARLVALGLIAP